APPPSAPDNASRAAGGTPLRAPAPTPSADPRACRGPFETAPENPLPPRAGWHPTSSNNAHQTRALSAPAPNNAPSDTSTATHTPAPSPTTHPHSAATAPCAPDTKASATSQIAPHPPAAPA